MFPANFRSFYLFRKGQYKYLLAERKKKNKQTQTPKYNSTFILHLVQEPTDDL